MALPINIEDLIQRRVVEHARIEYKRDWNPEPILHTLCAFANDIDNWGGGYLIIGMEEEDEMPGTVVGLDQHSLDRVQKELLQLGNAIEPRYLPIVQPCVYRGKQLLILWAPGGSSRPYRCPISYPVTKENRGRKAYYIRKMSSSIRANQMEEQELLMLSGSQPFDDRPNYRASIGDLKPSLLSEFLHDVGSSLYQDALQQSVAETASSMHLLGGPSEMRCPLNVGLMFFNDTPETFFPYARIEIVDKPDPTGEGMTEKVFAGPLDRQLRDALSYIKNYIIRETIRKRADRAEAERVFNYPYAAVEEALSNAVYHKSYQIPEPITVTVTPEKMELTSLPGPDRTIRDEDLKACRLVSRRYRNRRIGDFLKELKLVEGRNTGVPTMLRAMERNGSERPIFETDADRSYLTVILPARHDSTLQAHPVEQKPPHKRRTRAEIRQMIWTMLSENGYMATKDLVSSLGYARLNQTVAAVIKEMIADGILSYQYPEKPHARNQKVGIAKKTKN